MKLRRFKALKLILVKYFNQVESETAGSEDNVDNNRKIQKVHREGSTLNDAAMFYMHPGA